MTLSNKLIIISIAIIFVCIVLGGYLFHAQANELWPFSNPEPKPEPTEDSSAAAAEEEVSTPLPTWAIVLIVLLVLALITVGVYITILRYKIVGEALRQHQGGVAVAALSPEIGSGVGSIIRR